jgi:hypothetical protein
MIHWIIDALSHCFNDRFTDWLTDWLLRWFIDSLIHWLTDALILCFVDSLIHWFVDSLAHWFIGSLVHWFTDSFDSLGHRWFTDSLVQFVSVVDSLLCCFIDLLAFGSLIHWVSDSSTHYSTSNTHWLIASLLRCFIDSLIPWFIEWWIHPLMCSFMSFHLNLNNQLLIRWCISQIQHFIASASQKNFPMGHLLPIVVSFFRNFCPGACRALSGIYTLVCFAFWSVAPLWRKRFSGQEQTW